MNEPTIVAHWERIFTHRLEHERSWTEPSPTHSIEVIASLAATGDAPIIDVGGGASRLVDHLIGSGHLDVTVLDVSRSALCQARARVGHDAPATWIEADITRWRPTRQYAVWHDRAVFHFLDDPADLEHYRGIATLGVRPGGHLVMGTFAPDGPDSCSGLPVRRWPADELAHFFSQDFQLVASEVIEHHTPSGGVQPFTWVTLRRSA